MKDTAVYTCGLNQTAFSSLLVARGLPQIEAFRTGHTSDNPYVFNNIALVSGAFVLDLRLGNQLSASWALFAGSGSSARYTATEHQRGQDTLVDWSEAFDRFNKAKETRLRVRVIGSTTPGLVHNPAPGAQYNSSAEGQVGGFANVWRRCELIWSIENELQV